jgi:hypothetical protein
MVSTAGAGCNICHPKSQKPMADMVVQDTQKSLFFSFAARTKQSFQKQGYFISSGFLFISSLIKVSCSALFFYSISVYEIICIVNQSNTGDCHSSQIGNFWMFEERMTVVRFSSLICFKNLSLRCETHGRPTNVAL